MAFPSSVGSGALLAQNAIQQAVNLAGTIKQQAQTLYQYCTVSGLSLEAALSSYIFFQGAQTTLTTIEAIPGIATAAQTQIGSSTENISADFTAMLNALAAVVNWINTNFPKDANGNLLYVQFNGTTGAPQYTTIPVANLSSLAALLTNLIGTIN